MGIVFKQTFGDQYAALHAVENFGFQDHFAAFVADGDVIILIDVERCGIVWVDEHSGFRVAFLRSRGFGEAGVQKGAGWAGGQAERMRFVAGFDGFPMVGEFGQD